MQAGYPLRLIKLGCWIAVVSLLGFSSLCAQSVEATEGLRIMADRNTGNCVSCHEIPAWKESSQNTNRLTLQGNFGPSLQGVGSRYNKEQLRQWIVDARLIHPNTLMPPYGTTERLHLPARSQNLLTQKQIDAVVDTLTTFKQASVSTKDEKSSEALTAAGLAQLQSANAMNPIGLWIDEGKRKWEKNCTSCHALEKIVKAVPNFPKLDASQKLINLEDQISACRKRDAATTIAFASDQFFPNDDTPTLELSTFLNDAARQLSINIAPPTNPLHAIIWKQNLAEGEKLFKNRQGHMNLSCQQCHDGKVGASMRAQKITAGHPTGFPAYRISWQGLGSIERRIRACYSGVQAQVPAPQDMRLRQLELYLKTRAQGLQLDGPSIRQ
ncbi:MAG: sulfur oxidation c-type cytochrome SoxA [Burkholderiales bacterium]|nr:sulfur oxidation c-type cytochrome SoxA [Burkholderiales bacterium]